MTSTMDNMEKIVKSFTEKGIRDKVKIIVGGAPITPDYADEIGADTSKPDAMEAAHWAKEIVKELPKDRWN
jgi:methanogenic corrinoid protein MtbC1